MAVAGILLPVFLSLRSADAETAMEQLGERFARALEQNDRTAFQECWLSTQALPKLVEKIDPLKRATALKEVDQMADYYRKRDQELDKSFQQLIARIAGRRPVRLKSIQAVASTKDGITKTSKWDIVLDTGGAPISITVDDGFEVDGRWYFSDRILMIQ